jgi:ATP-dependent Clp protease ATP-binding subunit ClpC
MNNFTPRAQQVLALARKEADRFNHNYVGTEHLLLGLIKLGQGVAVNVLQKMGLDLETVRMEVEKHVGSHPETKMVGNIPYTPRVKKVLALAGKEAKALNHSYVGTEHILLGLLREGEGVAARVLKSLEVDIERTRNEILKELDPNFTPPESEAEPPQEGNKKDVKTPALRAFGRDLTELAKKGELDPVIGRRNEIERVIQILCRRTKNNPVLLGEAGVGKTAIVEGLAQEIHASRGTRGVAEAARRHRLSPRASARPFRRRLDCRNLCRRRPGPSPLRARDDRAAFRGRGCFDRFNRTDQEAL